MPSVGELDKEIRSCAKCANILALWPEDGPPRGNPVVPRPVLSKPMSAPILLIGQAPGPTEYRTGRPFSGGAGDGIRELMAICGLPSAQFDQLVYQTSVVKCFPGRKLNGSRWEDRVPCGSMVSNCKPFLEAQIALVRPRLIVTLGGFPTLQLNRLRKIRGARPLSQLVGTVEDWKDIRILFLPHTSGKSRFFNADENKRKFKNAKELLSREISKCLLQLRDPVDRHV
jgi:uracil-DNA glycosylase